MLTGWLFLEVPKERQEAWSQRCSITSQKTGIPKCKSLNIWCFSTFGWYLDHLIDMMCKCTLVCVHRYVFMYIWIGLGFLMDWYFVFLISPVILLLLHFLSISPQHDIHPFWHYHQSASHIHHSFLTHSVSCKFTQMLFTEQCSYSHTYRLKEQILPDPFSHVSSSSESPPLPSVNKGNALHIHLLKA